MFLCYIYTYRTFVRGTFILIGTRENCRSFLPDDYRVLLSDYHRATEGDGLFQKNLESDTTPCYAIKRPSAQRVFAVWGQKYCTLVYVYHWMVIIVRDQLVSELGILDGFVSIGRTLIYPVFMMVLTIAFIYAFRKVKLLVISKRDSIDNNY